MVVSYHNQVVVMGGWVPSGDNPSATVSNRVFELQNGSWVELQAMPDARAAGAAAVVGNQIVVFGGQANGQPVSAVDVYDSNRWSTTTPLPNPRDHLAGVSDGRYVYAVGGRHLTPANPQGTVDRYDPLTRTWTALPSLPTPREGLAATIVGGDLVTAGGEQKTRVLNTVEILHLSTNTWSTGPPLQTARHGLALVTVESTVYALGGATLPDHNGSTAVDEALDFTSAPPTSLAPITSPAAAWRTVPAMPTARQQMGAAVINNEVIWVAGGLTSATASTSKVEGYDTSINTWGPEPTLPLALHHEMVVSYHNQVVVMGGWVPSGDNPSATVSNRVFQLQNGSWVELQAMPDARAAGAAAVVGNQIVVFGGQANGQPVSAVDVYDGNRWSTTTPLPNPRDHLAGVSDGRYVYAVGGRHLTPADPQGTVDRYDPLTRTWTALPGLPTPREGLAATIVGGDLVTAGGEQKTRVNNTVEILNLSTNTWSTGPPLQTARHGLALVTVGSTVYALGGATLPDHNGSTAVAEALDFTSGPPAPQVTPHSAWRSVQPMPTARQQMGATLVDGADPVIWVVGGLTSATASTSKVEGYDTSINTWRIGPELPLALHHEMVVTYQDKVVVMGGWVPSGDNPSAMVSNRVFELQNGSWVELQAMPDARAAGAAAVVGNQIVVFGGQAHGQPVSAVDVYDGNRWSTTTPLPNPRDHLAGVSDGHYVYAVGGRHLTPANPQGTVDRYDPLTQTWTALPSLPTPREGVAATIVGGDLVTAGGEQKTRVLNTVEILNLSTNTWSTGPPLQTARHGLALVTVGSTVYALGGATLPDHNGSTAVGEALDF
jgi:non-specific serine/threonine protein kinase